MPRWQFNGNSLKLDAVLRFIAKLDVIHVLINYADRASRDSLVPRRCNERA